MRDSLMQKADIIRRIRHFFAERDVVEVFTPLLYPSTIPDPYIESFYVEGFYLQTSPEFAMKQLLAQHSGSIYQLDKVFRKEELGRIHNPEFILLEWYRVGFDHHELMDEMDDLLALILKCGKAERVSYQSLFERHLKINPHTVSVDELAQCAKDQGIVIKPLDDKDDWLNLLLTHCIEPHLGLEKPVFLHSYPVSQSALAKIKNGVAERFEVYYHGIELANGFHELNNGAQQRQRFLKQLEIRKQNGQHCPPLDENFLQALDALPACAGVALGVDRLIMLALGLATIQEPLFSFRHTTL